MQLIWNIFGKNKQQFLQKIVKKSSEFHKRDRLRTIYDKVSFVKNI